MNKWTIVKSEFPLKNVWMTVRRDTCVRPDGTVVDGYYVWQGQDFVMVFGVTEEQRVVLVRQYKHGVQEVVTELPAGVIDESDADPLAAAARELREETGFSAARYDPLAVLFPATAKATIRAHVYLATGLQRLGDQQPDSQEEIEVLLVTIPELQQMIKSGDVRDSNSVAATYLALQKLEQLKLGRDTA